MAGSSVLPPEILHLVFENLTEHSDFYSLCLVSRYFYGTAIRFLYRRVVVPPKLCDSQEAFAAPLNALLSSAQQRGLAAGRKAAEGGTVVKSCNELSGCGKFVKYFKFDQKNIRGVVNGEIVEAAVENMTRLESFVWQTVTTDDGALQLGSNIVRTPRISKALVSKQNLRHLSLEKFFADTDIPLLHLNPLRSFSFVLESGFASFAHRRFPNLLSERTLNSPSQDISPAADYDIIRKILQTSAKTLKLLSLRSASNAHPQYNDEKLLFGGTPSHISSFPETSAEEMLHLDNLECLSISARLFTDSGVEILLQAIDFTQLRYLAIQNCIQVEKLLSALSTLPLTRLRKLVIQTSQSLLAPFLASFSGLRELTVNIENEALDWTAPGGLRRRFSTGEVTTGLLEAILKHADTLRSLSFMNGLPPAKKLFFGPAALRRLVGRCRVLRDLRVCVSFSEWVGVVAAISSSSSLVRVCLLQRELRQPLPPCLDLERYYSPKVTRGERLELCVRCYLQDFTTVGSLRVVGVGCETLEAPFVYRIVEGGCGERALRRVVGRKGERRRGGFWNCRWEECVVLEPFGEDY